MKIDQSLGLMDKILDGDENKKPQAKHLQTRAEYLLKLIKKKQDILKSESKKRKVKNRAKESLENNDENHYSITSTSTAVATITPTTTITTAFTATTTTTTTATTNILSTNSNSMKKTKRNKKKYDSGPMHFTANNEPRALNVLGDLDPSIFNECKEKMRPVKKSLKALDNPDEGLSETEQMNQTRTCLMQIGDQINLCLQQYSDPEQMKQWRSHLWHFVSKFTEFDAKKLYKLYKHAVKKNDKSQKKSPDRSCFMNENSNNSSSSNRDYFMNKRNRNEDSVTEPDRDSKFYTSNINDKDSNRDRDHGRGRYRDRSRDYDRSYERDRDRDHDRYKRYEDYRSRNSSGDPRLYSEFTERWPPSSSTNVNRSERFSSSNDKYYHRHYHHRDRRYDHRSYDYE